MVPKSELVQEVSVDEQTFDRPEPTHEPVEEELELRPSVEQEIQGKVDTNHPDATPEGLTRIAEERMQAREQEIKRTRQRMDRRANSDREARTRAVAAQGSRQRRQATAKRACSPTAPWDVPGEDPREALSQEQLARVNQEADRVADEVAYSRATVSRELARRVTDGESLSQAVLETHEELRTAQLHIPIDVVGEVDRREVNIEATVTELWEPSSPRIQQVGLLEDETGRIKFTSWKKSSQPWIEDGERVQIYNAAKSWYQGRVSIALTGWSRIHFPERGHWWE